MLIFVKPEILMHSKQSKIAEFYRHERASGIVVLCDVAFLLTNHSRSFHLKYHCECCVRSVLVEIDTIKFVKYFMYN
ncbi:hypothetical protein TNCT_631681 [Trichonephila clavata]|uniref:Uncharacterized protein n=1 Tax=Trichonephila clavata TaxID=2740835 RepID=A0A8X6LBE2_TRICU|nr:hypothetical protein TNCT_631681 [Trichonephila clavata]